MTKTRKPQARRARANVVEQTGDAVLALIAKHDRLWQFKTEKATAAANALHDQLRETKPATLTGAIAQLEFAAKWDDPDMAKSVAAGLREIAGGTGVEQTSDEKILALFRDWLDASRELDRHGHSGDNDEAKFDAALDRRDEIEDEIISTPGGSVALAIKTYFRLKVELADWTPEDATLRYSELLAEDGEPSWEQRIIVGTLRDVAKQVPELADPLAPIIHEDAALIDADIEIRWCRDVLADEQISSTPERDDDIREQMKRALDRIANTEAKTPRGDEIKLRHRPDQRTSSFVPVRKRWQRNTTPLCPRAMRD